MVQIVIPKEPCHPMTKKGRPGVQERPLVQMLDRQRVQQAAADAAKKAETSGMLYSMTLSSLHRVWE